MPNQMMRTSLGTPESLLTDNLAAIGSHLKRIRGPRRGRHLPCLLEDAVSTPRSDADDPGQKVLEFAAPHVLLIDKWNGSGRDVKIPAPMKRTLTRRSGEDDNGSETTQTGRAYTDASAGGCSWDTCAGLHKPAYRDGAPSATWSA